MEVGNDRNSQPKPRMILLGRMYEKISQKTGEKYYRGTLGYPQTFLFKDKNAQEDNVWCLYAQEREPTPTFPKEVDQQPHPRPITSRDPW